MQQVKYKIIGITISITCIALMSIIIYDCKERVKKEKQIRSQELLYVLSVFIGHIRLVSVSDSNYSRINYSRINYRGDSNYIFINSK